MSDQRWWRSATGEHLPVLLSDNLTQAATDDEWYAPADFGVRGKVISAAAIVATALAVYFVRPYIPVKQTEYSVYEITLPGGITCTIGGLVYWEGAWRCFIFIH